MSELNKSGLSRYNEFLYHLLKGDFVGSESFLSDDKTIRMEEVRMIETVRRSRRHTRSSLRRALLGNLLLKAFYDEKMAAIQYAEQALVIEKMGEQDDFTRKVSSEFREHSKEENSHSGVIDKILIRRGVWYSNDEKVWRVHGDFDDPKGKTVEEMIGDDLRAEGKAVAEYSRILELMKKSCQDYEKIERIRSDEEKHIKDLTALQ